jgi:hypothetical protein
LGSDGSWSGRLWKKAGRKTYERSWCETTRVVGDVLKVTYNDSLLPPPKPRSTLSTTISAWGAQAQANLARLHIGVAGLGGAGSIVAESLARMGIQHISLIDFDSVEEVNLDLRVTHIFFHIMVTLDICHDLLLQGS